MSLQITVTWEGLNEMVAGFNEVATVLRQEIVPYAMSYAIQVVADVSQAIVPVRTGNLKNSMMLRSTNPEEATIAYTALYAIFVERGTSRMSGRLYLQDGFEQGVAALVSILLDRLQSAFGFVGRKY